MGRCEFVDEITREEVYRRNTSRVGKKVGCCRSERSAERDSASIIGSRWIRALGKEKDSSVALVKVTGKILSSQPWKY